MILVFEDDRVAQLDPVAIGKPACAIGCGGYRLVGLLRRLDDVVELRVRPHLRQVVADDEARAAVRLAHLADTPRTIGRHVFVVNARVVPEAAAIEQLRSLDSPGILQVGEAVVAAVVSHEQAAALLQADSAIDQALRALRLPPLSIELATIDYPHDILRHHLRIFGGNLEHRLQHGKFEQLQDGVFVAPGATIGDYVTCDTKRGPIVLDEGASIGPYCYLSGPIYLGPGTRVLEHAALKDGVAAGHTVKIGGEVEASIIEPFTNKQHHGFLGHSYLGSWINLGAGTCNSDLKNTYGTVNMEYRGQKVSSGMQFIGAIIGDYAKTAINTGIFTGKTIGACSMVYGFVTTNVPSFVNYARLFGQVTEAPVEVMVSTQRRMFARRGVEQRPSDIQLLHDMHALTTHERAALGQTLSIEPLSL